MRIRVGKAIAAVLALEIYRDLKASVEGRRRRVFRVLGVPLFETED